MQNNNNNPLLEEKNISFNEIITCSENLQSVLNIAKGISDSEINVLISGETGTGKELVARAIHNNSPRKNGPFVVVNCAGMPDTLLESELFGHEKGAFTDASERKCGKFELANKGTIFLDEVGDLSPVAQPKTLRAIEEKKFFRIGGQTPINVDCRIISATNKILKNEIAQGKFREDLYYRLCEIYLELPPLRERKNDIPLLIENFIKYFNGKYNKSVQGASDVVKSYLTKYSWPGNIRELKSIIKISMALINREKMWLEDMPFKIELRNVEPSGDDSKNPLDLETLEKEHIIKVLKLAQWNKVKASELLRISRPTLDRKISKYKINPE